MPIISLKNVSKTYSIRTNMAQSIRESLLGILTNKKSHKQTIKALKNINIDIYPGDTLGIIGRNGSGKSTLLNIIMESILPDTGGKVITKGSLIRLSLGMGVDPNLTARDNIYINGSVIGLSFKKIGIIFGDIIQFAGLEDYVDTPVKFYSRGMKQRLMFSIAIHANSDTILLDEFFGGTGDEDFKAKSAKAFKQRILEQKTIVIVSHAMKTIQQHCSKVVWLEKGKIIDVGQPITIIPKYRNSFTKA